ncbi:MAG: cytochrome c [Bryobacteraceae bacterium]
MKTVLKLLGVLLLIFFAGFGYFYFRDPRMAPPKNIVVDKSPERIARGKYIFTNLSYCDDCHSEQDFSRLARPVDPATRGYGKLMADKDMPGEIYAANITPDMETGIGSWTDGEKIRAIREGVDKNGRALFPIMPYQFYRYMSDEDVEALVAYLDTMPAVKHKLPATRVNFPDSMWMKGDPRPVAGPINTPDRKDILRYGEYLQTISHCEVCHTPYPELKPDLRYRLAGGRRFVTPAGTVYSANITPDKATGIGDWDFTRFKQRLTTFREYENAEGPPKIGPDRFTMMPYEAYSHMADEDMQAIFSFLQTVTPIRHKMDAYKGELPE